MSLGRRLHVPGVLRNGRVKADHEFTSARSTMLGLTGPCLPRRGAQAAKWSVRLNGRRKVPRGGLPQPGLRTASSRPRSSKPRDACNTMTSCALAGWVGGKPPRRVPRAHDASPIIAWGLSVLLVGRDGETRRPEARSEGQRCSDPRSVASTCSLHPCEHMFGTPGFSRWRRRRYRSWPYLGAVGGTCPIPSRAATGGSCRAVRRSRASGGCHCRTDGESASTPAMTTPTRCWVVGRSRRGAGKAPISPEFRSRSRFREVPDPTGWQHRSDGLGESRPVALGGEALQDALGGDRRVPWRSCPAERLSREGGCQSSRRGPGQRPPPRTRTGPRSRDRGSEAGWRSTSVAVLRRSQPTGASKRGSGVRSHTWKRSSDEAGPSPA